MSRIRNTIPKLSTAVREALWGKPIKDGPISSIRVNLRLWLTTDTINQARRDIAAVGLRMGRKAARRRDEMLAKIIGVRI
jgi:hypothetical protein